MISLLPFEYTAVRKEKCFEFFPMNCANFARHVLGECWNTHVHMCALSDGRHPWRTSAASALLRPPQFCEYSCRRTRLLQFFHEQLDEFFKSFFRLRFRFPACRDIKRRGVGHIASSLPGYRHSEICLVAHAESLTNKCLGNNRKHTSEGTVPPRPLSCLAPLFTACTVTASHQRIARMRGLKF